MANLVQDRQFWKIHNFLKGKFQQIGGFLNWFLCLYSWVNLSEVSKIRKRLPKMQEKNWFDEFFWKYILLLAFSYKKNYKSYLFSDQIGLFLRACKAGLFLPFLFRHHLYFHFKYRRKKSNNQVENVMIFYAM